MTQVSKVPAAVENWEGFRATVMSTQTGEMARDVLGPDTASISGRPRHQARTVERSLAVAAKTLAGKPVRSLSARLADMAESLKRRRRRACMIRCSLAANKYS